MESSLKASIESSGLTLSLDRVSIDIESRLDYYKEAARILEFNLKVSFYSSTLRLEVQWFGFQGMIDFLFDPNEETMPYERYRLHDLYTFFKKLLNEIKKEKLFNPLQKQLIS